MHERQLMSVYAEYNKMKDFLKDSEREQIEPKVIKVDTIWSI
jgi:hypothetical protein